MGVRLLLDTNTIIALFNRNQKVVESIDTAEDIFISVINELEFKSFPNLSLNDIKLFDAFVSEVSVLDLNASDINLKNKIIESGMFTDYGYLMRLLLHLQ